MKELLILLVACFLLLTSCGNDIPETIKRVQDNKYGVENRIDAPIVSVSSGKMANSFYIYGVEYNNRSYTVFYSTSGDIFAIENK